MLTAYSNAGEVELVVNGVSLMKRGPSTEDVYEGLDHPPSSDPAFRASIRAVIRLKATRARREITPMAK